MKKLLLIGTTFLAFSANAQTTLVSATGDGGFETGTTFAANNWTVVNGGGGAALNKFYVGAPGANAGARGAFISNDGGTTNAYDITTSRVVHFYRTITITAAEPYVDISFNWRGVGEGCCDYLQVFLVPSTTIPVLGTQLTTGQLGGNMNMQAGWVSQTVNGCFTAGTYNLVFSWRNDASVGVPPPISIDNISVISNVPPTCTAMLGAGVTNVASLPYSSGAGTTCGSVDNITTANAVTCGSTLYQTGEDRVWIFTPTATGQVTITLTSAGSYTGLQLYNGCPLTTACTGGSSTCIANAQSSTGNKTMTACVTAGVTYYLVLDSWAAPACNAYSNLTISAVVPPGSCAAALGTGVVSVPSLPYSSGAGTTCGSVDDLTSSNTIACGSTSYLGGEDRVYMFTPTSSGSININLTSTGSFTGLMLYDGCPLSMMCSGTPGSCIANAQSSAGNQSLSACVSAGTTYYLILDSWPAPACNPFSNLTISAPVAGCAYTNASTSYAPSSYTAGTLLTFPDDQHSAVVPIGFSFCYYGTTYTQAVVSSNSYISFNTAMASTYSPWVTVPIPTTTPAEVVNSIMFPWQDIDPSVGATSDIRYLTSGVAPNRKFIVNFATVPMFSASCNSLIYTGQCVLNETANTIEHYIQTKPICATWNSGNAVHGLNGPGGCDFSVVPGRNNTNWTATNDARLFTPGVCCPTILPVELIGFNGENLNPSTNKITWVSASEVNFNRYELERSADGLVYELISTVPSRGNSTSNNEYSFFDNAIFDRTYYRLKVIDNDGTYKYSNTVMILNTAGQTTVVNNIYPNPVEESVFIDLNSTTDQRIDVVVRDITGKQLYTEMFVLIEGSQIINLDMKGFGNGVYFIDMKAEKSSSKTVHKLIKK